VHSAVRGFSPVPSHHLAIAESLSVLLVLRAFASGSAAMTGIEAISNAVPSFKLVEWRNARITLTWMIALLIGMFAGVLAISRLAGGVWRLAGRSLWRRRGRPARDPDRNCASDRHTGSMAGNRTR
jgi:hypothetical protein